MTPERRAKVIADLADSSTADLEWFKGEMTKRAKTTGLNTIEHSQVEVAREYLVLINDELAKPHRKDELRKILRDRLRSLGYDARLVNGDCFDIYQGCGIHYLSHDEASALAALPVEVHPVKLIDYGKKNGLNYWYDFSIFDS